MITIGCAGFPVPATRYFKELLFVEIQETHLAMPGMGTVRRWRREAPEGFRFALLGPKEVGQEAFREGAVTDAAVQNLLEVQRELRAELAVFLAPSDFAANKANRAAVRDFLARLKGEFPRVAWEAPVAWKAADAEAVARDAGAVWARDPLAHGFTDAPFAYYRLPGPAGHKSRYEDPALERLGKLAQDAPHDEAIYVFANVDMFADAKRLKRVLGMT
jgi:uncharacterized protein YecE (DUF72 family)